MRRHYIGSTDELDRRLAGARALELELKRKKNPAVTIYLLQAGLST